MSIHNTPSFMPRFQKANSNPPFKTAKFREHVRENPSRSRSRSPNRSYSNNNSRNQSHNTSTVHSQYLWNAMEDTQIFSQTVIEMLKNQQRNILDFKKNITRQKTRINTQIQSMMVEINHIAEDYRLSLIAFLDKIYQQFINKYSQLKTEVMEINRLKQEVQGQYGIRDQNISRIKNATISNLHTIKTIQNNKMQLKKYQILQYVAQMQKQKIVPLNQIAEYLMILNQYENGFFQLEQFKNYSNNIRNGFRGTIHQVLGQIYAYIRDPDNIVFKQQGKRKDSSSKLLPDIQRQRSKNQISMNQHAQNYIPRLPLNYDRNVPLVNHNKNAAYQNNNNSFNYYSQRDPMKGQQQEHDQTYKMPIVINQAGLNYQDVPGSKSQPYLPFGNDSQKITNQIYPQYSQQNLNSKNGQRLLNPPSQAFHKVDKTSKISSSYPDLYRPLNQNQQYSRQYNEQQKLLTHSTSHNQVIVTPYKISSDIIRIGEQQQFSFPSKSMDVILCSLCIDSNTIVVGSKDGSLIFYNKSGNIIKNHQNVHKSAVCTLQLVNGGQFLASGSDHPNPEIILWSLATNLQIYCRFKQHRGAVTAIQCMLDDQHIISGSFDKRICVYSIAQRKLKYTLPSNKYSVTALTLNCNGNKLISCCLQNNSLNIWQIVRSGNMANSNTSSKQRLGRVQTIFLQQVVENSTTICSVVSSAIHPQLVYVGTKDGKLKIVDIQKSQSIKNMNCCNNAIVQIFVIEQNEGSPIVLCWPCKQKCFKIVDCETGKVTNVNTRGQLDFSCGVGPKATSTKDGTGFAVCSQSDDRQIYWYKIIRAI